MKLQVPIFPESSVGYNKDYVSPDSPVMTFSTILGITALLCSFSLVQRKQVESYLIHQS